MNKYLKSIREILIKKLWQRNIAFYPALVKWLPEDITLDHFAIIDIADYKNGFILQPLFEELGYIKAGEGYLADKKNHFIWLRLKDLENKSISEYEPQVVLANFNHDAINSNTINCVEKYLSTDDNKKIKALIKFIKNRDEPIEVAQKILEFLSTPRKVVSADYKLVHADNPLLAWSLINKFQVNHFGINLSFTDYYASLEDLHSKIIQQTPYSLNDAGEIIKGEKSVGIEQSSVKGLSVDNNDITYATPFIEFVWRYSNKLPAKKNCDYFLDFIADNANKVVESIVNF